MLFNLLAKTQNSHVKNHVDAKTTFTGQTILSCKNEIDRNDRNALFTLENCGCYNNRFFWWFFG